MGKLIEVELVEVGQNKGLFDDPADDDSGVKLQNLAMGLEQALDQLDKGRMPQSAQLPALHELLRLLRQSTGLDKEEVPPTQAQESLHRRRSGLLPRNASEQVADLLS